MVREPYDDVEDEPGNESVLDEEEEGDEEEWEEEGEEENITGDEVEGRTSYGPGQGYYYHRDTDAPLGGDEGQSWEDLYTSDDGNENTSLFEEEDIADEGFERGASYVSAEVIIVEGRARRPPMVMNRT